MHLEVVLVVPGVRLVRLNLQSEISALAHHPPQVQRELVESKSAASPVYGSNGGIQRKNRCPDFGNPVAFLGPIKRQRAADSVGRRRERGLVKRLNARG